MNSIKVANEVRRKKIIILIVCVIAVIIISLTCIYLFVIIPSNTYELKAIGDTVGIKQFATISLTDAYIFTKETINNDMVVTFDLTNISDNWIDLRETIKVDSFRVYYKGEKREVEWQQIGVNIGDTNHLVDLQHPEEWLDFYDIWEEAVTLDASSKKMLYIRFSLSPYLSYDIDERLDLEFRLKNYRIKCRLGQDIEWSQV